MKTQTETRALEPDELKDEAYRIAEATNEDGTVDVEIINIEKNNDQATVTFKTPWLETEVEEMDWPKRDHRKYKLVRLCEDTIGSFSAITQIEGSKVKADPDEWTLQTSEYVSEDEKWEKRMEHVKTGVVLLSLGGVGISVLGMLSVAVALLGSPFGVSLYSVAQGLSVLVTSIVLLFVSFGIMDIVIED